MASDTFSFLVLNSTGDENNLFHIFYKLGQLLIELFDIAVVSCYNLVSEPSSQFLNLNQLQQN